MSAKDRHEVLRLFYTYYLTKVTKSDLQARSEALHFPFAFSTLDTAARRHGNFVARKFMVYLSREKLKASSSQSGDQQSGSSSATCPA